MSKKKSTLELPTEEQIIKYLQDNPDFFSRHQELLTDLHIPHQSGAAVSLVERQLGLLRERSTELRQRLSHLMEVARNNDRLFEKTRRLILNLLDVQSLEDVIATTMDSLHGDFNIPHASLILLSEQSLPGGRTETPAQIQKQIGKLLNAEHPVFGTLRSAEMSFLFGTESREIGSAAVVSLGDCGVLAVGNADPQYYSGNMDTLFLTHIAEILQRFLERLLPLQKELAAGESLSVEP